jgi:predicted transposase/invertase (TIGR01784 family)
MSEDEANRMIYEARLKAQRDDYSRMEGARQKGELNATKRIVLEMDKEGLDIKTITRVTHLNEQEVNNILKKSE